MTNTITVPKLDITLQRGTYGSKAPFTFALRDINGAVLSPTDQSITDVTIVAGSIVNRSMSAGTLSVDQNNNVVWLPTAAEVNACPRGRVQAYYIEITYADGSGLRIVEGFLQGQGV